MSNFILNPNNINGVIYAEKSTSGYFEFVASGSGAVYFDTSVSNPRAVAVYSSSSIQVCSGWSRGTVDANCTSIVTRQSTSAIHSARWAASSGGNSRFSVTITDSYGSHDGSPSGSFTHRFTQNTAVAVRHTSTNQGYIFKGWKIDLGSNVNTSNVFISAGYSSEGGSYYYKGDEYLNGTNAVVLNCIPANTTNTNRTISITAEYEQIVTVTISYSLNGGSGTPPSSQQVTAGNSFTLPSIDSSWVKQGYFASGWNTSSDGTGTHYEGGQTIVSPFTSDTTIYVEWTVAPTYTVYFSLNGGSGIAPSSITIISGSQITFPGITEAWTKSGYAPVKWNSNSAGTGTDYEPGQTITVYTSSDVTYYIKWEPAVTIQFNKNDGSGADILPVIAIEGLATATLPFPSGWSKDGYLPIYWGTSSSNPSVVYGFGQTISVSSSITLYAIYGTGSLGWTCYLYGNGIYDYSLRNGSLAQSNQCIPNNIDGNVYVSYGQRNYNISGTYYYWYIPAVVGFGFLNVTNHLGYIDSGSGAGNYAIYYSYNDFNSQSPTYISSGYLSYFYTVNSNTGNITVLSCPPSGATTPANQSRWGVNLSDGQVPYSANIGQIRTINFGSVRCVAATESGQTLSVTFTIVTVDLLNYQITESVSQGSDHRIYRYYNSATLSIPSKIHSQSYGANTLSYVFLGWYVNGVYKTDNLSLSIDVQNTPLECVHEARYTLNSFIVLFIANGGAVSPVYKTVQYGAQYGDLPTPSYAGVASATFAGWYLDAGLTVSVGSSTTVTTAANHNLYAKWSNITVTVYFNGNGGTPSFNSKSCVFGSTYGQLPTVSGGLQGYFFTGWYTLPVGGTLISSSSQVESKSGHTLYAQWSLTQYTITFNGNGGTPASQSLTYFAGQPYTYLPTPTYTGKAFEGWYTSDSGGTKVSKRDIPTASTTLYAYWSNVTSANIYTFNIT